MQERVEKQKDNIDKEEIKVQPKLNEPKFKKYTMERSVISQYFDLS